MSHWAMLLQTATLGHSICVGLLFIPFSIFSSLFLSFLPLTLLFLTIRLKHSSTYLRTNAVTQTLVDKLTQSMALTLLQTLLGSFAEEVTLFCLKEIQSQLFVWPLTHFRHPSLELCPPPHFPTISFANTVFPQTTAKVTAKKINKHTAFCKIQPS